MVNVYDECGDVVARVKYNSNLDYYDGSDWTCGSVGRHKGITKLANGQYVLIHGSQWDNEKDTAEIITKEEALQEILKAGHAELLNEKKYSDLAQLNENILIGEYADE